MQNEIQFWRKKAEATPSAQILKGELENLKVKFFYLDIIKIYYRHSTKMNFLQ